jgi:hypothetical protein
MRDMSGSLSKPLNIAGTARGEDTFWTEQEKNIKTFSGNSLVVKKYKFHVKKK